MNNKKRKLLIGLIITFVFIACSGLYIIYKYQNTNCIPDDYIAVFHGGSGVITYSTYIYKIKNGQANYGFKYINTTNTNSSANQQPEIMVTDRGKINWTDDVFDIAKKNNAYSYVQLPNENKKIYTIDEFWIKFSMD